MIIVWLRGHCNMRNCMTGSQCWQGWEPLLERWKPCEFWYDRHGAVVSPAVINAMFLSPLLPITACAFRYNGLSFVYLIYLLLIPLFSEPTKATMQGKVPYWSTAELIVGCAFLDSWGLSLFREKGIIWAAGVGVQCCSHYQGEQNDLFGFHVSLLCTQPAILPILAPK